MEPVEVKRLDHHGVVATVIDDLKTVEIIDERIPSDGQEEVTVGEAFKAMIQNGLGFSNRALMLTRAGPAESRESPKKRTQSDSKTALASRGPTL